MELANAFGQFLIFVDMKLKVPSLVLGTNAVMELLFHCHLQVGLLPLETSITKPQDCN